MSVSFKYEILPFDTPWAGSRSGLFVYFKKKKKVNRGRLSDFWRPAGEMARAHILWSHRVGEPPPQGRSAGEFSTM